MHVDPDSTLPDDVAALKAMVLASNALVTEAQARAAEAGARVTEAEAKVTEAQAKVDAATRRADELFVRVEALDDRLTKVNAQLLKLRKMYYGPRADRFTTIEQVAQLPLEFTQDLVERPVNPKDVPQEDRAGVVEAGKQARTAKVSRRGRRDLTSKEYEHLPERIVEHDLSSEQKKCTCCGEERCKVSVHKSYVLEYIPGHFERITHVQPIYIGKSGCAFRSLSASPAISTLSCLPAGVALGSRSLRIVM